MIDMVCQWMGQLPFAWAEYQFMQHALLSVLLLAPLLALLGCLVVNNQMALFSEALGHASLTGIALGTLAGMTDPLWAMMAFGLLLAVGVVLLRQYSAAPADTVYSLIMAFTVALGIVILSRGGGFARYSRFLIGDILTIAPDDIRRIALVVLLALAAWLFIFNPIFMVSLNRSLARSRGIPVVLAEIVFAALLALVVTVSVQWIGLLVINSLLVLPAAAARQCTRGMRAYLGWSAGIGLFSGVSGLIASFYITSAAGATIVLVAMGCFVLALLLRRA